MEQHYPRPRNHLKPFIACGLIVALVSLMFDTHSVEAFISHSLSFASSENNRAMKHFRSGCETDVVESAKLSREQLLALLAVPERESKTRIRQIVQAPYCQLSAIEVRAGVAAEREAYPLAFDPNVALVILYENDEYAGYRFKH